VVFSRPPCSFNRVALEDQDDAEVRKTGRDDNYPGTQYACVTREAGKYPSWDLMAPAEVPDSKPGSKPDAKDDLKSLPLAEVEKRSATRRTVSAKSRRKSGWPNTAQ